MSLKGPLIKFYLQFNELLFNILYIIDSNICIRCQLAIADNCTARLYSVVLQTDIHVVV